MREKFEQVDLAIVGIGDLEPSALLLNSGNYYDEEMLRTLAQRGAVGDICLHYFDAQGEPMLRAEEDPVIGMELAQGWWCSGGRQKEKAHAIRGALRGGWSSNLLNGAARRGDLPEVARRLRDRMLVLHVLVEFVRRHGFNHGDGLIAIAREGM